MGRATETVHGIRASRALLAGALALAVLWAAALTASPGLHEWVHADADHEDHDCAVTLFLSGAVGPAIAPLPPVAPLAGPAADFRYRKFLPLPFVGPSVRSVLEHGPPRVVSRRLA
jgi:hypothetical protein